ncbi:ER membrane protein complex subunit 1 [Lamellibrachia satsuma]|nr:ER membrane protein complex subunit 1 [Lamellibrachia satsuma]
MMLMLSVALQTGGILELPKALLDPRRPIIPTPEHREEGIMPYMPELKVYMFVCLCREEGIMPYMPELPRPFEAIINYNQSVYKIHGIHTAPAGLESTCLVLCYGLDLFYTRVNPSKMFDVLKEDFDYFFISIVLVAMIIVSIISQKLAARKALNRAWK